MNRPYVFVVQDYDPTSQGNVIMYRLCHYLNERGYKAYMSVKTTNPDWNCPIATKEVMSEDTIVVYTDCVPGNPTRATRVVRWLMNRPEYHKQVMKWQWWRMYDNGDIVFTFDKSFAPHLPELKIREIDKSIFYPSKGKRKGIVYYLGKAVKDKSVKVPEFVQKDGLLLETGKDVKVRSYKELAEVFRKAEKFYCFTGSGLIEEALYCGCPVIRMGHFTDKVDWDGVARDDSPEEMARAEATREKRINKIESYQKTTQRQIDYFIKATQSPPPIKKQTIVLDFDDFSLENNNFYYLQKLKELYPKLKVSMFMIPFDYQNYTRVMDYQREEMIKTIKDNLDWIELIPHGLTHKDKEFLNADVPAVELYIKAVDEVFKKYDLPYVKGFKAPFWLYSQELVDTLDKHGWFMAVDRNTPFHAKTKRYYEYTHSIDEEFWKYTDCPVWRLHGHISLPNANNLPDCMVNLSHIPENAEFDFVSNHLYTTNL